MLISLKLSLYSSKDYVFLAFVQTRTSQHVGKFTTWVKIKRISAIKQAALYGHSDPSQEEEARKNPNDTKKVLIYIFNSNCCFDWKYTIMKLEFVALFPWCAKYPILDLHPDAKINPLWTFKDDGYQVLENISHFR